MAKKQERQSYDYAVAVSLPHHMQRQKNYDPISNPGARLHRRINQQNTGRQETHHENSDTAVRSDEIKHLL